MMREHAEGLWYDLHNPRAGEKEEVEKALGVYIPTIEEMEEIESSSRLYKLENTLYMTFVVLAHADSQNPIISPITFILSPEHLVTLRYTDPKPFRTFEKKILKIPLDPPIPESALLGLLESIVDRVADILEKIGAEIDALSKEIFKTRSKNSKQSKELDEILTAIGKKGDLTAKMRESMISLSRLLIFLNLQIAGVKTRKQLIARIKTLQRDVHSMSDHVNFMLSKINFLLDATLGYINIEQNSIIKIFSVAAVIFLPPTVIASIYGMNFKDMPELHWAFGYPFALLLMVSSALIPYFYFKRKGWL